MIFLSWIINYFLVLSQADKLILVSQMLMQSAQFCYD